MIKHIYFSYAESEGDAYSYLKYFFRSIGIWTQDEGQQPRYAIQIHILNEQCLEQISTEEPVYYYLVRKTDQTQQYFNKSNRNDLFELKWENRKLKCHDLCTNLVTRSEETEVLLDLLNIFDMTEAWGAYWIFHEISNGRNEVFNQYITNTCKKIKESVSSSRLYKNSWHHKFVMLYCDYIIYKTQNDLPERRMAKCATLLEKCGKLVKEKTWNTALCWLTARICELSPTERKFSILYYQKMIDRMGCYSSEIYYGLAYAYERIYGDTRTALQYYQKIYKNDENYYRAENKLALECESRAQWMAAILHYQHIYNITTSEKSRHISVRSIEYYAKALGAIINLFSIKDVSQEIVEMFRREWKKLQEENIVENRFGKITDLMFADSSRELLKNESEKDLHRKINSICVI